MSTVRDLLRASLLDLGAIASGEAMTADEAADGLRSVNLLLESWRLESLLVWAIDTVTKVMDGSTSYTIGPGGQINTTRPVALAHAGQRLAGTSPTVEYPLGVLSDEEYESLMLKGLTSSIARWVYLDRAFPLATLVTWPVLPAGDTLALYVRHPLTAFASLDTTVALPPGYERALQKCLALELSPQYRDCVITPALASQCVDAKAWLKTANHQSRFLRLPTAVRGGRSPGARDRAGFLSGWQG